MGWKALLGQTIDCACGRQHVVRTRAAAVDRGAIQATGPLLKRLSLKGPVLLVADPETWAAAGEATQQSLEEAGYSCSSFLFAHHPVAGPPAIRALKEQVGETPLLVAIGSGTINDIVKSTADQLGRPYVAVGTALSMNGYTSAISALLDGGIKRTVRARPPVGVVLDLDICAAAPLEMTLSGLGDMLSKPFSEADWRLASHLDGTYHCERPGSLLGGTFERMLADAGRIGRAEPAALGSLAEAILLSGISMAMAGVSSPASGGEHLISHYWDMTRYAAEKNTYALHGTQVGVACCLVEPLHHRVQELRGAPLDVERIMSRWPTTVEAFRERVRGRHPLLPTDVVERVVSEAERKWRHPEEQRERMIRLNRTLEPLLNHVGEALLPEGAIRQALEASGAPTRPSQIAASLSDPLVDWMHVRDMRGRYTVLDFAVELGLFGEPV